MRRRIIKRWPKKNWNLSIYKMFKFLKTVIRCHTKYPLEAPTLNCWSSGGAKEKFLKSAQSFDFQSSASDVFALERRLRNQRENADVFVQVEVFETPWMFPVVKFSNYATNPHFLNISVDYLTCHVKRFVNLYVNLNDIWLY